MTIIYPYSANHFEAENFGFTLNDDIQSYSPRPSIYVLLFNDENKIASIKYREEVGCMYPLPGGGVTEGETWEEGLMREIKEEVGCAMQNIQPIGSFRSYNNSTMKYFQSIICTAKLHGEPQVPQPTEDYEQGSELVWITMEELLNKLKELAEDRKDDRSCITLEILKNTSVNF